MDPVRNRKTLSLDVIGFPVPDPAALRAVLTALTATGLSCFALQTDPDNIPTVYITPEEAHRLTEIIRHATDPATLQLQALFRAQAKALFHDEGTLEIDDNAPVSVSQEERGRGGYVQAWAWVDKHADYACDGCEAQWLASELLHTPPSQQTGPTPDPSPAGYCPLCGAPCSPNTQTPPDP